MKSELGPTKRKPSARGTKITVTDIRNEPGSYLEASGTKTLLQRLRMAKTPVTVIYQDTGLAGQLKSEAPSIVARTHRKAVKIKWTQIKQARQNGSAQPANATRG
jgi:hypothetical protein